MNPVVGTGISRAYAPDPEEEAWEASPAGRRRRAAQLRRLGTQYLAQAEALAQEAQAQTVLDEALNEFLGQPVTEETKAACVRKIMNLVKQGKLSEGGEADV